MIAITLKGGTVQNFEAGITAAEGAKSISMGLYRACCCCKVNGLVTDLRTPLTEDCALELCTFDDDEGKQTFWHPASHIMAQAVKRLSPNARLSIGPAIE
ncbi:MAG: TGS domain-containing protein, partial [Clostridiales bacterium]|nr:TGS domain-containing protein [Clostridiales bacterium]